MLEPSDDQTPKVGQGLRLKHRGQLVDAGVFIRMQRQFYQTRRSAAFRQRDERIREVVILEVYPATPKMKLDQSREIAPSQSLNECLPDLLDTDSSAGRSDCGNNSTTTDSSAGGSPTRRRPGCGAAVDAAAVDAAVGAAVPVAPALPLLPPALPPAALRLDDRVVGMMDSLLWLL